MLVLKAGAELKGMGRLKLVLAVCRQDSWWRAWVLYVTGCPCRRWNASCTRSSVCRLTRYWQGEQPKLEGAQQAQPLRRPAPLAKAPPPEVERDPGAFLTCRQGMSPSEKLNVPMTSSPIL